MDDIFDNNELNKFITLIKNAKNKTSIESYIYIKNILNSVEFPIPSTKYPIGTKFIRARVHKNNEDFFHSTDQLSYRKDLLNIKEFGRANEPGQSIFYCSNNQILSFVETSNIAKENKQKEFEYLTESIWISTKEITVVNLLTNDYIKGQHLEMDNISRKYEHMFESQNNENSKIVKDLLEFLSKEFSQVANGNSNHYKITAAFANYIYDNYDGILYPSTLYLKEGFNFAFQPNVVDTKMKFYAARRIKMTKISDKEYADLEQIESLPYIREGNIISWPHNKQY
jgi:RES domain